MMMFEEIKMKMLEKLNPLIEPLKEFEVIIESDRYCSWLNLVKLELYVFWDENQDTFEREYRAYNDDGAVIFRSALEREMIKFIKS